MTQTRSRIYENGVVVATDVDHTALLGHLQDEDCVVWVDLCGPTQQQLHDLADHLGLHELAVEDALEPHQRPKLDRYGDHLFIAVQATSVDLDQAELRETEVDVFVGDRWMITVRADDGFAMDAVVERWDRSSDRVSFGVGFLLYGLLDVVVDGYFESVETFDEYYDEISETIFSDRPIDPREQIHWFQMRKALFRLHRLSVPMRELLSALMRRERGAVSEDLYPYFQDVYDHILRITESTDALRDLVASIVETNLSLRDYRQNQVMKKVTSWAAIIAVPTLITGYYGMNVKYPGITTQWGWLMSMALMGGLSLGLYVQFKRNDWL
jgi:magnesium transporter